MKKPYYSIIILFFAFTFSSAISANNEQNKYISYIKNKLTRISKLVSPPLNIKSGIEQVVFIELKRNGILFTTDIEKPIKNKIFSENINYLIILTAPYRHFPDSFDKNIKLSKIKITFVVSDTKDIVVKEIKLVEFKTVIP